MKLREFALAVSIVAIGVFCGEILSEFARLSFVQKPDDSPQLAPKLAPACPDCDWLQAGLFNVADPADDPAGTLPRVPESLIATLSKYAPTADYQPHGDYLLSYDGSRRCPRWTLELLDRHTLSRNGNHERPAFRTDPDILPTFAATNADFEMTGFDKGHSVPAEDMDHARQAFEATFTLANVMPQQPNMNRGGWKVLESYIRRLAIADGVSRVWVLTAPAWIPSEPVQAGAARLSYVRVKCIGKSQIWVPTHCCKSCLVEHEDGGAEMQSWIVPNTEDCRGDPQVYRVAASEVQRRTGLDLWRGVPGEQRMESMKADEQVK